MTSPSNSGKVIYFNFHGIGEAKRDIPREEELVWVSHKQFCTFLDWACDKPDIRITFDDGNSSDVEIALPELQSRKMRATFFVLAGRLDQYGSLGSADLKELRGAGMTIGLHGMDHRSWRGLNYDGLTKELVVARKLLENVVGHGAERIVWAACPFGAYGHRALTRLKHEGFNRVFTSDRGAATESAWLQERNTIHLTDDLNTIEAMYHRCRQNSLARRMKLWLKRYRP